MPKTGQINLFPKICCLCCTGGSHDERSASEVQDGANGLVLPDKLVDEKLYCTDVVH